MQIIPAASMCPFRSSGMKTSRSLRSMSNWSKSVRILILFVLWIMRVKKLKESFPCNWLDYNLGALIVTTKDGNNRNPTVKPLVFNVQGGRRVLNPYVWAGLVDGCQGFVAFKELAVLDKYMEWKYLAHRMSFLEMQNGQIMSSPHILLYGQSSNCITDLVFC